MKRNLEVKKNVDEMIFQTLNYIAASKVSDAEAENGGGANLEADPGGGALGFRLLHAPKGVAQLRAGHSTAWPRAPQRRINALNFFLSYFN